jgi:predicted nucleic acid-binding protein
LIFVDTNIISETLRKTPNPAVIAWLVRNDAELALPTVTIAEIAFGIGKNSSRPEGRALGAGIGLLAPSFCRPDLPVHRSRRARLRRRALRQGRPMTAPDGMIAAIARINGGRLATRNLPDFETTGLELTSPWDF